MTWVFPEHNVGLSDTAVVVVSMLAADPTTVMASVMTPTASVSLTSTARSIEISMFADSPYEVGVPVT